MNKIIYIFFLLFSTTSFSQITSGKITYKVVKEFNPDSDYYKFFKAQHPDCFYEEISDEVEYVLEFSKDQALFYANTKNITNASCVNKLSTVLGTLNSDESYIYTGGQFYSYMFHLGKRIMINEKPFEWVLTDESKSIQGLICYKAYYIDRIDLGDGNTKLFTHTIWYAPELPFEYGPYTFVGAPGLVLEANHQGGKYTYGVSKMEFNIATEPMKKDIEKLNNVSEKMTSEEFMSM